MSKITLNDVADLTQATTAKTVINDNKATIQTAFDNTLSRDGTAPNQMESSLDMNNNQILNLPAPSTNSSPLRLSDLNSFVGGGTVTNIPAGGTTGQALVKHSNTDYDVEWATGSVSSVGLALPADFTVTGSPVTSSGTLTGAWATTPTGTGAVVKATSPTLVTPTLGVATATSINGNTLTTGTGTLTLNGNTLTANNTGNVLTDASAAGGDLTGTLPNPTVASSTITNAKLATAPAYTLKGNATGSTAAVTDISIPALTQKASPAAGDYVLIADSAASNALKYATVGSVGAGGTVSSVGGLTGTITLGNGLTTSANSIVTNISKITNSLAADVALSSTSTYFDGPSVAQGTTGTWWAAGKVTITDTASVAHMLVKLWDGTTVIDSAGVVTTGANNPITVSLAGYITSPASNIRISVRDASATTGKILFNDSGNSKDSTVSAIRIA